MRRDIRIRIAIPLVLVLLATTLSAFPSPSGAQSSVRGVLFDSLLTGKPVADAEVVLIENGTGRRTTTDRRGQFSFDDVPAGTHRPNASACGLQFWKYKSFVPTLCTPELWVNGRHDPDTAAVNLAASLQRAKRVEVYRAPFVPVQFSNLEDCGSVVVWTR